MSVRSIGGSIELLTKKKHKKRFFDSNDNDDEDHHTASKNGKPHRMSQYEKDRMLPVGASRKDIARIKKKAKTYSSGFSIIGLTRVFTGNPFERVLWFIVLTTAISFGLYMTWELFTKYIKRDVRVDKSIIITNENHFPTVTICLKPANKKRFCDYHIFENRPSDADVEVPCDPYQAKNLTSLLPQFFGDTMVMGPLRISCKARGTCNINTDLDRKYFRVDRHIPQCFVWNYDGNYFNDENRLDLDIEVTDKEFDKEEDEVRIYLNDGGEYLPLEENYLTTTLYQHYQLSFKKTVIERLPEPHPSKCVTNTPNNIFPGKYSLLACMESKRCLETYKRCGDSYDFCRPFIPQDIQKKYYKKNVAILDMHECLELTPPRNVTDCDLPCNEIKYDIYGSSYHFKETTRKSFRLSMRYEDSFVYSLEKEEELYTWGDLLGGAGGNIGLFCGFSFLSIVEIISFIVLRCYATSANKRLKRKENVARIKQRLSQQPDLSNNGHHEASTLV